MATYTTWAQHQLDIATGEELDRVAERLVASGVCPHCGGSGRIFWGVAGEKALRSRPCERCGDGQ